MIQVQLFSQYPVKRTQRAGTCPEDIARRIGGWKQKYVNPIL